MKKSLLVLGSCLSISLAAFTGCESSPSSDSGSQNKSAATVSSVTLHSVTLPEGVNYSRNATKADESEVKSNLENSDIASKMTNAANYSKITSGSSNRDMSYADLDTVYDEIRATFKDFSTNLTENGTASASYEKEIGQITDYPEEGVTMSIPKISISEDAVYQTAEDESGRKIPVNYSDNFSQSIESKMTEDLTTTMGDKAGEVKSYAANSAQNYTYTYAYTFDNDGYKTLLENYETKLKEAQESGDYKTLREVYKEYADAYSKLSTTKYNAKIDYATSSVLTFVTKENQIAGKLKIDINLAGDVASLDTTVSTAAEADGTETSAEAVQTKAKESSEDSASTKRSHKSQSSLVDDTFKASVTMDVYDLDDNLLFNYKTVSTENGDSVKDVLKFISFLDTTNLDSMYTTSSGSGTENPEPTEGSDEGTETTASSALLR